MMATKTENITNRLTKVRDQLSDELKTSKNDLSLKIEETDSSSTNRSRYCRQASKGTR